jgi:hypothetical protein
MDSNIFMSLGFTIAQCASRNIEENSCRYIFSVIADEGAREADSNKRVQVRNYVDDYHIPKHD